MSKRKFSKPTVPAQYQAHIKTIIAMQQDYRAKSEQDQNLRETLSNLSNAIFNQFKNFNQQVATPLTPRTLVFDGISQQIYECRTVGPPQHSRIVLSPLTQTGKTNAAKRDKHEWQRDGSLALLPLPPDHPMHDIRQQYIIQARLKGEDPDT